MKDLLLSKNEHHFKIQELMNGSSSSSKDNHDGSSDKSRRRNDQSLTMSSLFDANDVVGCVHYEAKSNIVAPCCNRVFGEKFFAK